MNVPSILDAAHGSDSEGPGRIARIVEGVFHPNGGADEADLDENDGWLDLGPEDPIEKKAMPAKKNLTKPAPTAYPTKGYKHSKLFCLSSTTSLSSNLTQGLPPTSNHFASARNPTLCPFTRSNETTHPRNASS